MSASYGCIAADPPWAERGGGRVKRGADRHYPLMREDEIIRAMLTAPCWKPLEDAHLWLWVTNNHLGAGLRVMGALGFRYVTNMAWVKADDGEGQLSLGELQPQMGLGQYLRGSHELALFGTRGRACLPDRRDVGSVVIARRGRHSEKPAEAYERFERVSPGPRLEMFARAPRDGWDVWGNEIKGATS